jgi:hypothetical protein
MPRCPRGAFSRELAGTILGKAIGEFCDCKLDEQPAADDHGNQALKSGYKALHPVAEVLQRIVDLKLGLIAQVALGPTQIGTAVTV